MRTTTTVSVSSLNPDSNADPSRIDCHSQKDKSRHAKKSRKNSHCLILYHESVIIFSNI